jgi:hypothetical protein
MAISLGVEFQRGQPQVTAGRDFMIFNSVSQPNKASLDLMEIEKRLLTPPTQSAG